MGVIEDIRASLGDAFITLPILLNGFIFLFGILTSNTGLLYLFIGQLLLVPSIGFLTNLHSRPWFTKEGKMSVSGIIASLWSFLSVLRVNTWPENGALGFGLSTLAAVLIQFYLNAKNPPPTVTTTCAVIPTEPDDAQSIFTTPSLWVLQICFFIFFILSNAKTIYDLPTPTITKFNDEKTLSERKARLEDRVRNRKFSSLITIFLAVIALVVLLAFRYLRSDCEKGFFYTLPAIFLVCMTGYNYFTVLIEKCGVQPADVLGIVPGLIHPDILDNPVVCVGD